MDVSLAGLRSLCSLSEDDAMERTYRNNCTSFVARADILCLAQVRTAPVAQILAGLESISYQNQRWSGLVPMFQQICQRREILDLQAALHFNIKNNDRIATDQ
jgi:hypothetical protein